MAPQPQAQLSTPTSVGSTLLSSVSVSSIPTTSISATSNSTAIVPVKSVPTDSVPTTTLISPTLSSTTSVTITNSPTQSKNGLSGGAVGGVAIGCLLAGAVLATLVCFLLFGRKDKKQPATYPQQNSLLQNRDLGPEKGAVVFASTVTGSIDHLLPQPVEDDAIIKEVSRIRDNIKNHAQTYYHSEIVPEARINGQALAEIAETTGMSSLTLAGLLSNPSTRGDAIRFYISYIALSRCEDSGLPSLLPRELASLAVAIPRHDANKAGKSKPPIQKSLKRFANNFSAPSVLFSKWKTITGALLQSRYGRQGQTSGPTSQGVSDAIVELNLALAPFVQGSLDGGQRHNNLELILGRAESLAFLLFSQPSSFRFDFTGQRALVVFPALLQVINEQAQALNPPRVLWDKETADLSI
jgi:hypothetical protein